MKTEIEREMQSIPGFDRDHVDMVCPLCGEKLFRCWMGKGETSLVRIMCTGCLQMVDIRV